MTTSTSGDNSSDRAPDLRARAIGGFLWSALEGWGNKGIALVVTLVLARVLTPEVFGIASAAGLLLALCALVAEFGFSDAIVQRRDLTDDDVSLPFYVSLGLAVVAAGSVAVFAGEIASWLGIGGYQAYVTAIACTLPLTIPMAFQEAIYRKRLRFRALALRGLVLSAIGGAVGIGCAYAGLGVWTFVVQAYVGTLLGTAWFWWRPLWVPGRRLMRSSFGPLLRFSLPTIAQRLNDFAGTRIVDIVIITQVGLVAYGMFVMASRIYQTLLQLLQGAFFRVSFALLSQISQQRERMMNAYEETVAVAASAISPVFAMLAALSPEICAVMFDAKWAGIEDMARPMLILGAVHSVQYMNGAFLAASGKPGYSLLAGTVRSVAVIAALLSFKSETGEAITWTFVLASILATPLSYLVVTRTLQVPLSRIVLILARPWALCAVAFGVLTALRPHLALYLADPFPRGMALGTVFATVYCAMLWTFSRQSAIRCLRLLRESVASVLPERS